MPIKGVSEIRRLPRLGKIHLGIKKKTERGVEYPSPTDYFVCPEEVQAEFGEKPRELRIMFPSEDDSRWASQWLRCYSATRGLICKGDGQAAMALVDVETGEIASRDSAVVEMREVTCSPESCPEYGRRCRRVMSLQFLIPEVPGVGIWQLDTTSFYSIVNINSAIDLVRGIYGRVSMIPLTLSLVPQEVQPEGRRKTVHVLTLTSPYSLIELRSRADEPLGLVALPDAEEEMPEDLFPEGVLEQEEAVDLDHPQAVTEKNEDARAAMEAELESIFGAMGWQQPTREAWLEQNVGCRTPEELTDEGMAQALERARRMRPKLES